MLKRKTLLAFMLLALSGGGADAGVASTVSVTSDYDFRGISQTAKNPALQASVDYADESNGWYAGAWVSPVDFGDSTNIELDLRTGFTGKTDAGLGWDAGIMYYVFDEDRYNFPEIYTAYGYRYFNAMVSYSNDFHGRSMAGHTDVVNLALDATVPLPVKRLSLLAHVGRSEGNDAFVDYTDYSAGLAYDLKHVRVSLKYVNTTLPDLHEDELNGQGRAVFAISARLP